MQSIFPFVFVLLFTAPAFFPRDLLTPALREVAAYNPLTYVVEGVRALLTGDPALGDPWLGLAAAVGLAVATIALATAALAQRLRRL
jgi:ABC-2 type transport system permease protein